MGWFRLFRRTHEIKRDVHTRTIYRDFTKTSIDWDKASTEVASVLNLRADSIASLPLQIFKGHDKTGNARELATNLFALLNKLVRTLDTQGAAYLLDTPIGVYLVPADRLEIHNNGTATYTAKDERKHTINTEHLHTLIYESGKYRWDNLERILAEQAASWEYRAQVWRNAGRVGGYLSRPAGIEWDKEDRDRFTDEWHEFARHGARAGEIPVLEDGMKLERFAFSAKEEEWEPSQRLTRELICNVFNVPVAFFEGGKIDRETKTFFYTETLAPLIRVIEETFTKIVRARLGRGFYCKFNLDAKLSGSFEEQAQILSTATGAPWLTVNEARELRDLPPIEGGNTLVVPLNVTQGGQASPQDGMPLPVAVENAKLIEQQGGNNG